MLVRLPALITVLAMALTACAPAAPSTPAGTAPELPSTPTPASTPPELAQGPAAASPTAVVARRGGTLRVGVTAESSTIDPHYSTSATERHVFYALFNTLVGLDSQLRPVPELAEAVEQPDAKTLLFKLRKGVKFNDGT